MSRWKDPTSGGGPTRAAKLKKSTSFGCCCSSWVRSMSMLGPLAQGEVWELATPYIATRYAKTRGRHRRDLRAPDDRTDFLLEDLREQVRQVLGIDPNGAHIEAIADEHGAFKVADRWRPIQFKRYRSKRSDDGGQRLAGAFRIRLDQAVTGPIVLGHSSHFGMGLFMPVESALERAGGR